MIIVENRAKFLDSLPKNGIVAEVGVLRGGNASNIIEHCQPSQLVLVDPWKVPAGKLPYKWARMNQQQLDEMYEGVVSLFTDKPEVSIIRATSLDGSQQFPDHFFDWVYIDGDHRYDAVLADLQAWSPKIKPGGLLCGHDYDQTPEVDKKGDGVYRAVKYFCAQNNLIVSMASKGEKDKERDFCIQL